MTKLYYITHPSVEIDKSKPPHKWGLSEKGLIEAKKLLEKDFWREVNKIYSSKEPKAVQVAELASNRFNVPTSSVLDLGEADRSKTPFLPLDEYMNAIEEAYTDIAKSIHGWESHKSVYERNKKVIDKIKNEHSGKVIVIIGHGGAGTLIKCYIKGVEPTFDEDPKQTGCLFIADLDNMEIIQDWQVY